MFVNSTDNEDFILDNVNICYTDSYTYLRTPISCRCVSEQVQLHPSAKSSHVIKFTSFLAKTVMPPFSVKKSVWNSVLQSAILLQLWNMAHKRP